MPEFVWIDSQSRMDSQRRQVDFCYLCGRSIKDDEQTQREHVIPKSMLRMEGLRPSEQFPIVLDVHAACDFRYKQKNDNAIQALIRMHQVSPAEWTPRDLGVIAPFVQDTKLTSSGEFIPAISATRFVTAVRAWLSGCVAATYLAKLPMSQTYRSVVRGPWPELRPMRAGRVVSSTRILKQARNEYICNNAVLGIVAKAAGRGCTSGIRAWGGQIEFRSFVMESIRSRTNRRRVSRLTMYWTLEVPCAIDDSVSVRAQPVPWHGYVGLDKPLGKAPILKLSELFDD